MADHPEKPGTIRSRHLRRCALCIGVLVGAPAPAEAFEVSGGVSLGGVMAGAGARLAVTPHASILWRVREPFLLAARESLGILPATDPLGAGVYSHTALALGYGTANADLSIGPSLSIYSMPACNSGLLCARVVGLSPGGYAELNLYFAGSLGVSVNAGLDWLGGNSVVLPAAWPP